MNRRSFFARMLGAACLAVAERVLPSSIGAQVKPMFAEPAPASSELFVNFRVTGDAIIPFLTLLHPDGTLEDNPKDYYVTTSGDGRYMSIQVQIGKPNKCIRELTLDPVAPYPFKSRFIKL